MRTIRGAFAAFAVTVCVLGLGVGLYTVGYNSRRVLEGKTDNGLSLQDGKLLTCTVDGTRVTLQPADETAYKTAVCPAPLRVSARLLQKAAALAEKAAAYLSENA